MNSLPLDIKRRIYEYCGHDLFKETLNYIRLIPLINMKITHDIKKFLAQEEHQRRYEYDEEYRYECRMYEDLGYWLYPKNDVEEECYQEYLERCYEELNEESLLEYDPEPHLCENDLTNPYYGQCLIEYDSDDEYASKELSTPYYEKYIYEDVVEESQDDIEEKLLQECINNDECYLFGHFGFGLEYLWSRYHGVSDKIYFNKLYLPKHNGDRPLFSF
jgi:hypothetical protein